MLAVGQRFRKLRPILVEQLKRKRIRHALHVPGFGMGLEGAEQDGVTFPRK